ncbi:hypothetical protein AAG906_030285 [Vitis piasezkii]
MRQEGWSSKHPRKEDGSRRSIHRQAITWSSSWVTMHINSWEGRVDFTVAPMDDFKMVLGMDFLEGQGRATTFPTVNGYPRGGEAMHGSYGHEGTLKTPMLSAMQVKKGLKREEVTYLATLKEERDDGSENPCLRKLRGP